MPHPPTGTVTFVFTDIEGSTRRWEHLPAAMASALLTHDRILRAAIEEHSGFVFKTVGDAFCAAFADPGDALRAALAAQRALATGAWSETGPLRVRMALHTGQPEHRERDYFGPPVNRVARILSTGAGEQVLVSAATEALVGDRLPDGTTLRDLGAHRLKDLLQPERIFQLCAPDIPAEFPPLKSLDRQPHNLPAQPTPLVQREADVARVRALVEGEHARLVTLTGPGGTGKTRLALQAAAELVDTFPDGAWFADLSALTDPALVADAIAQPLGVRETGHEPLEASLLDYLRDKTLLLVLDNFEHVLPAVPLVGRLLAACPGVKALATSRAALRAYGEREMPVPPLALPDLRRLPALADLAEVAAVELFVERAQAVKPGFDLTSENATAVAVVCVRLEGLPLAIELAAARVRILAPDQLLARLGRRLDLLTGGAADRDPRQQTLRGAIAWSHDLLPPDQQTLFHRLAVFAGGCTLAAAEAVINPDGRLNVLDGLDTLVTQSLLRQDDGPGGELRFRMLETIREFAIERLDASEDAVAIRTLHAACYLAQAEQAEPELTGPEQGSWLDRLEAEHDNFRGALTRFAETAGAGELRLAAALCRFWYTRGHLSEGRRWMDDALARSNDALPAVQAKALEGAGILAEMQGDLDLAVVRHEAALALSRGLDDTAGIARSLINLATLANQRGERDRAAALFADALTLAREIGNERLVAIGLDGLCRVALEREEYDAAEAYARESLALYRKLGDAGSVGGALQNLGMLAYLQKDVSGALALYEECLGVWRHIEERIGATYMLVNLGRAARLLGDLDRAVALFDEASALFREMGDTFGIAYATYSRGLTALGRGDAEQAAPFFAESLALYQELGYQAEIAECLEGIAGVVCACGDAVQATLLFGAAAALRETIGVPLKAVDRDEYDRHVAAARLVMGDGEFAAAWAMGRAMSPEQAIAEARAIPV